MEEALSDPVLGRLLWDEEMGWWIGETELFPSQRIELFIDFDRERESREAVLSKARVWIARVRQREPEYRRWAAGQLVGGRWNLDEPMTAADIEGLLRLLSMVCASDGSAQMYWDDEDVLYYGHGFYTQLAPDGECVEVRMQ